MTDLKKLNEVFDYIVCVSLSSSDDRRAHIRSHFADVGIHDYQFFDAIPSDAPIVDEYYWNEKVQRYPKCFRCNKLECGKDNCNNVLIPSQVATWISHQKIWEFIQEHRFKTALIVEDDIQFNDYAPLALVQLVKSEAFQNDFQSDRPCLLRLGWRLREDHTYHGTVELSTDVIRMSNPCYAINQSMAVQLATNVKQVDTTVDVYVHRQIAPQYHHYTLLPPLAHEHSSSTGALSSLIHPKQQRVDYLIQQAATDADIQSARQQLNQHIRHAIIKDVLCVGHPRCGSGYISNLLQVFGLKVGHERVTEHGISSWMFAADDEHYPYAKGEYARSRRYTHFRYIIHHVRSPFDAIPSLIVENQYSEKSFEFRRKHIQRYFGIDLVDLSPLDAAVASFIYWNRIIELMNPKIVIRIETDQRKLFQFLKRKKLIKSDRRFGEFKKPSKDVNTKKPYNGKIIEKPDLEQSDWDTISDFLKLELRFFCKRYGYDNLADRG